MPIKLHTAILENTLVEAAIVSVKIIAGSWTGSGNATATRKLMVFLEK
jgi:hypothetical protein